MANQLKRKLEEIAAEKMKEEVNMVQNEIKLLMEDKLVVKSPLKKKLL
jgi:hypothetical protein